MADVKLGNKLFIGVEGVKLDKIDGGTVTYFNNEGDPTFTWNTDISTGRIEFPSELTAYLNDNLVEGNATELVIEIGDVVITFDDATNYCQLRGGAIVGYEGGSFVGIGVPFSTDAYFYRPINSDAIAISGMSFQADITDTTGLSLYECFYAHLRTDGKNQAWQEIDFSQFAGQIISAKCICRIHPIE